MQVTNHSNNKRNMKEELLEAIYGTVERLEQKVDELSVSTKNAGAWMRKVMISALSAIPLLPIPLSRLAAITPAFITPVAASDVNSTLLP